MISISRERITDELKEFVIVAIYLYVCFTALAYLKFAILHAHGIAFAPFGLAAVRLINWSRPPSSDRWFSSRFLPFGRWASASARAICFACSSAIGARRSALKAVPARASE